MIKRIRKFITDFIEFRKWRQLARTVELNETHKHLLYSYNKDLEKEMNSLILHELSQKMVSEDITPEYYRWFRSALSWRIAFISVKEQKFPINKN